MIVLPGQLAPSAGELARARARRHVSIALSLGACLDARVDTLVCCAVRPYQGTLCALDTPNPVLYLTFPEARRYRRFSS